MRRLPSVLTGAIAAIGAIVCNSSPAVAQTLVGEQVAGAFVTMTAGVKCPATTTVAFRSQGEASGSLEGVHDEQGSISLRLDDSSGALTIAAFRSAFQINTTAATGEMTWEAGSTRPLRISCDPLSLRIGGEVRYRVTDPFVEDGIDTIEIAGSRRTITAPYFGHTVITFAKKR